MNQEIEQLKEAIKSAEKKIQELEAAQKDSEWPKLGDRYWTINWGEEEYLRWDNDSSDERLQAIGNMFKTKEEANAQLEALKVCHELRSQPGSKKFEVDDPNWTLEVGLENKEISVGFWSSSVLGFAQAYFDSVESCQAAINKVGKDRILKAARWLAMGEV